MMEMKTLENNFTYHEPKGDQVERYEIMRKRGLTLAKGILKACPESAERTLAIRQVEVAIMWANAAIARNEE